jgi:hypothetical protein
MLCQREFEIKDLYDYYYASHATLFCGQVGQEIKNYSKRKLKSSPTILGVGLVNHSPKV